jgi:hypothetical protein
MTKDENYSLDLIDTVRGFSILNYSGKEYFFRHFSLLEFMQLDVEQVEDFNASKKAGISTREELINKAIKTGGWSISKEEEIKSLKWMLKKSTTALAQINDPTQRKVFHNQVKSQEDQLKEIEDKRTKITSYSAEHLSELKRVKKVYDKAVFRDREWKGLPPEDHRTALTTILFARYNELMNHERMLRASYFGGFFEVYAAQKGNPLILLDTTFEKMTIFQKSLLVLTNSLLNKLRNTQIPDEIAGDPVKIFNYEEKKEEGDRKVSHGADDLKAKLKARGGELKPEDFLS